mgnify:CR=1 FL=1
MIRVAIVEDDKKYHEICQKLLKQIGEKKKDSFAISDFYNGLDFLETFKANFDLIIIDIEMPQINGLEVSESVRKIDQFVPIIIISHSAQYADKGYKFNAFGYIVKPISEYDFAFVMDKAIRVIKNENKHYIVISNKSTIRKIDIDEIRHIEVSSHILKIKTANDVISIRDKIKKYEEILKQYHFVRCDNSYLVNLKYCSNVNLKDNTVKVDDEVLPISRSKKKAFLDNLTNYIGDEI